MPDPPSPPLAIRNATVYPTPDSGPIERGTVVCRDGRVVALAPDAPVPSDALVLPGDGRFLVAGFWNCHVHFTEPRWRNAAHAPAGPLEEGLREMLTGHGFTTVVDTGSDPRSTLPLRRRVEAGELAGPRIRTAASGLYPPRGIPYYVRGEVPWWIRWIIPQPRSPAAARRAVERNVRWGADLLKLFTGSYVARGTVKNMREATARAAVEAAHRHAQLAFSHPSNLEGARIARDAGVDVLAHPPDTAEGVDAAFVRSLVERRMGLVPTLKMFATTVTRDPAYLGPIHGVVRQFREFGGEILFGTDVGYMRDYSTDEEYRALAECGLDARAILASLTTAPARRFGSPAGAGTVSVGAPADLVLLGQDPFSDPGAFDRVAATVRAGRVLYARN
jgi:imidazolonepropionase-like amidohydrolase